MKLAGVIPVTSYASSVTHIFTTATILLYRSIWTCIWQVRPLSSMRR
jgi:hypothetical protein